MTTVVKDRTPIVIPPTIQRQAGIKAGDRLEFKVSGKTITVHTKAVEDEYTPEQRRAIDDRIADARKGEYFGPFQSAEAMKADIEARISGMAPQKKRRTR